MLELGVCSGHELWVQIIVKCEICRQASRLHHQERGDWRDERGSRAERNVFLIPPRPSPRGWRPAVRRVGLTPDIYKWHALIDRCHRNNISPHQRYVYHTSSIGGGRQPTDSGVSSSSAALSTKIQPLKHFRIVDYWHLFYYSHYHKCPFYGTPRPRPPS